MAYGSSSGIATFCKNVLGGISDFTTATSPTLQAVNMWLTAGCSIIEARLSSEGYSMPPAESSVVWGFLAELNNLYGAARVEMSRVNVSLGPGERTRGQVFEKMFWDGLDQLSRLDLTSVGLSIDSSMKIYVGGTTDTEKDTWEDDSDRVQPRFKRGQFNFPETIRPDTSSASISDL